MVAEYLIVIAETGFECHHGGCQVAKATELLALSPAEACRRLLSPSMQHRECSYTQDPDSYCHRLQYAQPTEGPVKVRHSALADSKLQC